MIKLKDFLYALAGIYAIALFVSLEANPAMWSEIGRTLFVVWVSAVCAIICVARRMWK